MARQVTLTDRPRVQRRVDEELAEEHVQRTPVPSRITPMASTAGPVRSAAPAKTRTAVPQSIVQGVLSSPGRLLDHGTRGFMESRLGYDFGGVRIHTGGPAGESARRLGARAYTLGRDVVFGTGEYSPRTPEGRQLLAHELVHVVQQRGSEGAVIQRAETDTARSCGGLTDTKADVNDKVNAELGAGGRTPSGLHARIGVNTSLGRTAIEDWAEELGASKVRLPGQGATKYAGVTYGLWNPLQPFPILNPTMRINGICVGSDKLGHFLQQGFEYLQIFQQTQSEQRAVEHGVSTEVGGFGLSSTGVFSNADLEANRQGLRFYRDLLADPSMTFDIASYINANWNEETNPSHYEESVGAVVWVNLIRGSWRGQIAWSGSGTQPIVTNLTVADDNVSVRAEYGYRSSNGEIVNGTISGRISHTRNALNAITGVLIEFDWREGGSTGKGRWTNVRENELRGTWGRASSRSDGGTWNSTKSPTPIPTPLSTAARQEQCRRMCEEAFERCTRFSREGGMACIANRSRCLMSCG
ncbi:MAG: DUF4157 domain-containing protein [Gemmatimonas sp.]|nr:DUF4157 domain-containing protein [Gemmatimonas sp.]